MICRLLVLAVVSSGLALPTMAQDKKKAAGVKEKVQALLHKAEDLKAAGKQEEAQKLLAQAKEWTAWLEQQGKDGGGLKEILHGLEQGIKALMALKRHDDAERLGRIAEELRAKLGHKKAGRKGGDREREVVRRRIEIMGTARVALLEGDRKELGEMMQKAIRSLEVALEGRRDEEAMKIRKSAPSQGNQVELLMVAAKLWREFGNKKNAAQCQELAQSLRGGKHAAHKAPVTEREAALKHLDVMRLAMGALREGERKDAAEQLEHAIHALELGLEGRKDEEALKIRKTAPSRGQQAEILMLAGKIYAEYGDKEKAHACQELSRALAGKGAVKRHATPPADQIKQLRKQLEEFKAAIEKLEGRLRK